MKKTRWALALASLFGSALARVSCFAILAASAASAGAATLSFQDIQFWAGTGTNRAAMVIEWSSPEVLTNTSTPPPVATKCYAWGYRWNGSATAANMFKAIFAADPRLAAMVSDTSCSSVFGMAFDLNNNRLLGLQDGTDVLSCSPLTNATSFINGLTLGDWDTADEYQSLDVADLYWGGAYGPNWELWTEQGGAGGFTNAPDRGANPYWTPDDVANPWSGNHGQWHYADAAITALVLHDGSWVGWTVAAGGFDYFNPSSACTLAYNYHKHAPANPQAVPALLSPYGAQLVASQGPFGSPSALYGDPLCVLGEPATYNLNSDPGAGYNPYHVKIVEPAYNVDVDGNKTIVTLSRAKTNYVYYYGSVTIAFDHPVSHNPANPYGIDFEVFGNAYYTGSGNISDASDMRTYNLVGGIFATPLLVSVSPDGQSWYTYSNGPYCDTAFPTQGYQWDADQYDQTGNGWTQRRMDFTKPVNPSLNAILGAPGLTMPVVDALALYAGSGGGTGFDLAETGFKFIQYVRISAAAGFYGGQVDAVSIVRPAVLGEGLLVTTNNLADGNNAFFFQNPDQTSSNLLELDFNDVGDIALVTPSRLLNPTNLASLSGTPLQSINLSVVSPVGGTNVEFDASATLALPASYQGNGLDLDLLQWDGSQWAQVPFAYDSASHSVTIASLTNAAPLTAIQLTPPTLAIQRQANAFAFTFTPVNGWTHVLERSTDFTGWNTVDSVTAANNQPALLHDKAPPANNAFYRLRLVRP